MITIGNHLDAAIRRLKVETGLNDPVLAVRAKANALVSGLSGPPFDLDCPQIREAIRIQKISYVVSSSIHGRIFWSDPGYIIEIKSSLSSARRAFTLAHEISHSFFLTPGEEGIAQRQEKGAGHKVADSEEERLCDAAAAEMLMPAAALLDKKILFSGSDFSKPYNSFMKKTVEYGPSVYSILALARDFGTSIESTVRRFAEMNQWSGHFGLWTVDRKGEIAFDYGYSSGGSSLRIPRGFRPPLTNVVGRAVNAPNAIRGWSDIGFLTPRRAPFGEVFAEAIYLSGAGRILSVSIFEKCPASLYSMSQRTEDPIRRSAGPQRTIKFTRKAPTL
jgi:Zn-dependent peptidase ImmA (M78 family)